MDFPISGTHLNPLYLWGTGLIIGLLGGFFGVGGSFLAGPALFALGVPMNYVVGTDMAQIVGKSIVAARKHHTFGNVDIKLALCMVAGTITGVETGAQGIQYLKRHSNVDSVVAVVFIVVLVSISVFMGWESLQTMKTRKYAITKNSASAKTRKRDISILAGVARYIQRFQLAPMVSLPRSGIKNASLWAILAVGFVGGVFGGFLGGGAGYIRMPALVYLLGVPTHIAVGTDLFEIIISAGYGTLTHAIKGNVDILIALVMHTGAAIGAQIGAHLTGYFHGPHIRLAFVPLPLAGAALVLYTLITGHHFK